MRRLFCVISLLLSLLPLEVVASHETMSTMSRGEEIDVGKTMRIAVPLYDTTVWKVDEAHLTSSLRTPEVIVKEFFNGFVAFHDHCPGEKLSVEWQTDLYGRHCLSHSQHLVYA